MIRWDEPIEAYHEDGRVAPVELDPSFPQPDSDGEYALIVGPPGYEMKDLIARNGRNTDPSVPWRIRNVAQAPQTGSTAPSPSEVGPEVVERMIALVRRLSGGFYLHCANDTGIGMTEAVVEAQQIVGLLPEPVDADEVLARQMVLDEDIERTGRQRQAIVDGNAGQRKVALVLAAIKRGRALAVGDGA